MMSLKKDIKIRGTELLDSFNSTFSTSKRLSTLNTSKMKVCVVAVLLVALSVVSAELGSDLGTTLRIVTALCYFPGDHSDPIANAFFNCYDNVPEHKAKFAECQIHSFGVQLDTKAHIDRACWRPLLLPGYATCLKQKFGDEASMNAAVLNVNTCQGTLMKLD